MMLFLLRAHHNNCKGGGGGGGAGAPAVHPGIICAFTSCSAFCMANSIGFPCITGRGGGAGGGGGNANCAPSSIQPSPCAIFVAFVLFCGKFWHSLIFSSINSLAL